MIVNRDKYLQELVSSRHNGLIKIITGMRRCGKSFLLFQYPHDTRRRLAITFDIEHSIRQRPKVIC